MLYQPLPPIPLKKPLAGAFLDSVDPIPVLYDDWKGGLALPSYKVDTSGWPGAPCIAGYESDWSDNTDDTIELEDKASTVSACRVTYFDPFIVYHLLDSTADNSDASTVEQTERFAEYGDNWIDAQISAGVARAFYRGAPEDGLVTGSVTDSDGNERNLIPRTYALDLTSLMDTPASVHPTTAVAMLLSAYYGCKQAGGAVLHIPPLILPFLIAHGIVAQVGQRYLGPGGVVVISDPGMPSNRELFTDGSGSDSEPFPGASATYFDLADEGEAFCFVTGPVQAAVGPILHPLDETAQHFDVRKNQWVWLAERQAIFAWDPECCFAIPAFAPSPGRDEV